MCQKKDRILLNDKNTRIDALTRNSGLVSDPPNKLFGCGTAFKLGLVSQPDQRTRRSEVHKKTLLTCVSHLTRFACTADKNSVSEPSPSDF
jgi:hypothetical protein